MKVEILESCRAAVGLNEDVKKYGLDETVYLGVLEAELGRGGVVNLNGRVYRTDEFVRENQKLAEKVKKNFVEGELGHPVGGPTFDVPVRLIEVGVQQDEDGSVLAEGRFAVLNTQVGRDILTLYKAEMPLGVSSRGYGIVAEHTLDDESPYAEGNPDHMGKTVLEVSDFELLTYDLVRVPSAGTHVKPATQETREALVRVCEHGLLGLSPMIKEADVAKEKVVLPDVQEESFEAVEENEKVEEVSPLASLSEKQQEVLLKLASVIENAEDVDDADEQLLEQIKRVGDQADIDRQRLSEAEEANRTLTEKVAALEAEREAERKNIAIRDAIEEAFSGKANGERVRKEIAGLVAEGRLDDVESIKVWSERMLEMADDVVKSHSAASGAAVVEAVDTSDDLVDVEESETTEAGSPGLLNEDFVAQLKGIIERDRTLQGRV